MDPELRHRLQTLHQELGKTAAVDAESRALLVALLEDITRLLEQSGRPSAHLVAEQRSLRDRLDAQAVRFEAEHPGLGAAIRQVVDTLAKAGI